MKDCKDCAYFEGCIDCCDQSHFTERRTVTPPTLEQVEKAAMRKAEKDEIYEYDEVIELTYKTFIKLLDKQIKKS